ncbi:hypothetical protein ES332_A09G020300v1 [Gossypium tomentosum]|uniref:Reverse transcriptase zinc-binding domain-containing protein n=1 Tax=Gossypium tomentosum TaxID=34277 RepID=A0A5D2NXC2_GOSTO|nr:hypothetical protein ES332_A09G020300v1 [Gossypium tomentosum]
MGCLAKLKSLKELEDTTYPFCNNMDEILEHPFISCSFSRAMWFGSSFGFMPDHISLINLDRLLRLVIAFFLEILATLWSSWIHRNKTLFSGKTFIPTDIISVAQGFQVY